MIARGIMLGPEQPVILHLLDIQPLAESLKGVRMELIDAAFPLLQGIALNFEGYFDVDFTSCCRQMLGRVYCICGSIGILATTDVNEACKGVNIAVMVGGFPIRKEWKGEM